ncbi:nucleotidyltransferase domain-containing protein [uncultured Friedmanniella sp.]|uniref:nucleotidyltransferase domain-containing protein n=1 Tax=uncultured Friedmanniella sp. TaxID=335381 RepID=UPI0035C9860B
MFTTAARERLLVDLVARARAEPSVTAAALVGSAARDETDRWSDIDLALRLEPGSDPSVAADAWTTQLGELAEVADHLDVWAGPVLYRVFLLRDSLQVDLSFAPAGRFASTGEPFALLFGSADPAPPIVGPDPGQLIGWAWLYALHTRSALARGRSWQALQMLDGLRAQLVSLACLRHGLPSHRGRGVDQLPASVLAGLAPTLAARPDHAVLAEAFAAATALLLAEAAHLDRPLAARLEAPLAALHESPGVVA